MEDLKFDFGDENTIELGGDGGGDDEIVINKKRLPIKKAAKIKPKQVQKVIPRRMPPPAQPPPVRQMVDNSFEMFSNPAKRMPIQEEEEDDDDDEKQSEGEDSQGYEEGYSNEPMQEEEPSPGFSTIEDEKQDLLYKFYRLENRGMKVKKFNAYSDIREMRVSKD